MEQLHLLLVSFLFFFTLPLPLHSLNSDGLSLLALKAAVTSDPTRILSFWSDTDPTPCHWPGVRCGPFPDRHVVSLSLPNRNLTGYIPSELGALLALRRLSLSNNNFSRPIPSHLFNATSLLSLDLSHNSLFGPVPSQITSLSNLTSLDLSSNLLNGSLPAGLSSLTHLQGTLNLSCNRFSGEVPPEYGHFPVMVSLDLRHNNLTGEIPQVGSLLNQGPTAFIGNPSLCGFPLSTPCPEAQNPNPLSTPRSINPSGDSGRVDLVREKSGWSPISVSLISGLVTLVIVVGALLSLWVARGRWRRSSGRKMGKRKLDEKVGISDEEEEEDEGQKGTFVVVDDREGFGLELEDLLRASAYVVGKSRSGIVYKVVVGGKGPIGAAVPPAVVAVRRLSEADGSTWRFKDFEAEAEAIGRVQHPNIVRLRAYHYSTDEKLLISDFIRNGSLYAALHGGPTNDLPPLSWAARLKITQGTARGLAHIHECSPKKYVHGNIKSSKILLDEDLQPSISGFGLSRLVPGTSRPANISRERQISNHSFFLGSSKILASSSINAYLAPEARNGNKYTQKCDVYSFGILLMEILTGRFPDVGQENEGKGLESLVRKVFWEERPLSEIIDPALLHEVYAKKQVLATFHIALSCTESDPELRPRMRVVSESLDRVKYE